MQKPGTTKFCSICNAQYINELMLPALRVQDTSLGNSDANDIEVMQGGPRQEPMMSLARILYAACDRCVCCGGKFAG